MRCSDVQAAWKNDGRFTPTGFPLDYEVTLLPCMELEEQLVCTIPFDFHIIRGFTMDGRADMDAAMDIHDVRRGATHVELIGLNLSSGHPFTFYVPESAADLKYITIPSCQLARLFWTPVSRTSDHGRRFLAHELRIHSDNHIRYSLCREFSAAIEALDALLIKLLVRHRKLGGVLPLLLTSGVVAKALPVLKALVPAGTVALHQETSVGPNPGETTQRFICSSSDFISYAYADTFNYHWNSATGRFRFCTEFLIDYELPLLAKVIK